MNLKYSQVAQLSSFSNDKMVGLLKTKLAESENAAVALVFDDKLIVLDEENEKLYSVSYKVENKALKLSDWEPITLLPDDQTKLEELAENFFDPMEDKEVTVRDLVEAFRLKYSDEPVKSLINKAEVNKKSIVESNSKIKALTEVRKTRALFSDDILEVLQDPKVKALMTKMTESGPVQGTITKVDFKNPISVALFEEVSNKVINLTEKKKTKMKYGNVKKKVQNMWTSESFKKDLGDLVKALAESEDPKKTLNEFINQHIEILILENSELEDLILKTSLMIGQTKKSDDLAQLFREYSELEEAQTLRDDFINRNNLFNEQDEKDDKEAEEPVEEPKASEKETAIDEDSLNKILKIMNKIKENLEEKTMEAKYIGSFITALEDAKVGSIGEGKLKEVLDFLNSIYEQAQEVKDSEEE